MIPLLILFISIAILVYMREPFTRMYYMTVTTKTTKSHPVLNKIQEKMYLEGQTLYVRGFQEERQGDKLREIYEFLHQEQLNDKDIVLFTEPHDVALIRPQKEILKRYKEFHTPIVFGAEKMSQLRAGEYKTQGEAFPYLNSGVFIGRVWALRKCMENYTHGDPQQFWTEKYFQYPDLIILDTKAKLFLSCNGIDKKLMEYDRFNQKLVYSETGTQPMVVHANCADKSYLHVVMDRWKE